MAIPCPHFISSAKAAMEAGLLIPSSPSSSVSVILTQDDLKKIAAYKAVEYVESGMVLGLGTGSTAKHAVDRIGELLRQGKLTNIIGIPTSTKTHEQAVSLGIPLSDLDSHPVVDLAIDGADEVDPYLNLVKGRGGSLLREKMVEGASGKLQNLFEESGCVAKLRTFGENQEPYVTDNGNYIIDLYFEKSIGDLKVASDAILNIAGVVEHGMFLDMATTVIVAVFLKHILILTRFPWSVVDAIINMHDPMQTGIVMLKTDAGTLPVVWCRMPFNAKGKKSKGQMKFSSKLVSTKGVM
ncbi:Ribose-5-phosphate isomerase B (Phosphoriboisomerase B) (LACB) (RPIB) [Trifolium repens]|nr:Ribose-5-phosphate isomerase B (Phosphoriboisomerase B) (LACB) (RPIB) [Trifolium repens]